MGLFFQAHMLASVAALSALAGALVLLARAPAVHRAVVEALARLPITGPWLYASETGRWATLLGNLLDNRVPMLQALDLSARGLRIGRMRVGLAEAQREIRRGRALSDILLQQRWLAATRVNLVRVGERAGELPRMLAELGRVQTETARTQLQRVLALIEPLAILLIGSVVGVIMVGVVLAIASVNTARF
jgi:general secretion pathway protein F